jgi:hypothetical protein
MRHVPVVRSALTPFIMKGTAPVDKDRRYQTGVPLVSDDTGGTTP